LILAVIYQSFGGFLGTNYTAAMNTKGVFYSSLVGGIVSVIGNFLFLPILGLQGAGIATLLSFFIMFIIRLHGSKKYAETKIHYPSFLGMNLIFVLQTILLFFIRDKWMVLSVEAVFFLPMIFLNRQVFTKLISMRKGGH
jgi:O-antigen/teichoic acid export membrane protein